MFASLGSRLRTSIRCCVGPYDDLNFLSQLRNAHFVFDLDVL